MNYTLHQLLIFQKIAKTKSITKAAEELHLTQPAVSIQLKNFQQQFKLPLIETINKRIYITDFGNEVLNIVEKILNETEYLHYKNISYSGNLSGKIRISVVSTGKYIIPYFLANFLKQHPDVNLNLDVTNKTQVINSIEKNEVDFGLVSLLPDKLNYKKIELMPNKLFLVGNLNHIHIESNKLKDIVSETPVIFREEGSATRMAMEKFLSKHNIKIHKKIVLTSNEAVKQAVIAGLGISIMPVIGIGKELIHQQINIIPVRGLPLHSNWHLIWHADKTLSPVANYFKEYLQEEKNAIITQYFAGYEQF